MELVCIDPSPMIGTGLFKPSGVLMCEVFKFSFGDEVEEHLLGVQIEVSGSIVQSTRRHANPSAINAGRDEVAKLVCRPFI